MNVYFERYAYPGPLFSEPPDQELKIIVVIPCFNEPDICNSLDSLQDCKPVEQVEVIIIVNEPEHAPEEITRNNERTLAEINNWQKKRPWFNLLSCYIKLPAKDAGVGLARKAGMDEAARRLERVGQRQGLIACFDADSTCTNDYFTTLEAAYYKSAKKPVGSSIYFEHPYPKAPQHRQGIIQYELHLRYYVQALCWAGYPYAHHTIGSSMVVRADIYQKIGGMNKRKAGEDFYFLHRLIPAGYFTNITETCIYPSPRVSKRVPFGTGKAMEKWQVEQPGEYYSYNLESFRDLRSLFEIAEKLQYNSDLLNELPDSIKAFLATEDFPCTLNRLRKQSTTKERFRKNFYAYFDGFKVLKYLHFSRDNFHPSQPVIAGAMDLIQLCWPNQLLKKASVEVILEYYRKIEKSSNAN